MKHLGPVALLTFWSAAAFILKKWTFDMRLTLSDHVATGPARFVYVPSVLVSMSLFVLSCLTWFLPHSEAHWTAYVSVGATYSMKLVTALIPRTGGLRTTLHDLTATATGVSMQLFLISLFFVSAYAERFRVLIAVSVALLAIFGGKSMKRDTPHYLASQGAFFLLFSIVYCVLTYLAI